MNALIRDIIQEMDEQCIDSFLLKIDFHKAFDSISREFLYKCFEKMGIPYDFILSLMSLDVHSTAKLLINGHLSNVIKLERGARQGDPSSTGMDKFIVVMNVLIVCLYSDSLISPYHSITNKTFFMFSIC